MRRKRLKIKRFGILFNQKLQDARKEAYDIAHYISSKKLPVYIEAFPKKKGRFLRVVPKKHIIRKSDMLFAIGGDGTILKVARELGISEQTVKNHMTSILRKLAVNDRTQAAIYALRRGWIRLQDT